MKKYEDIHDGTEYKFYNVLEYYSIDFPTPFQFRQMKQDGDSQIVNLFCQTDLDEGEEGIGLKSINFNLETNPKTFDGTAQFGICKKEAEFLIKILKLHFDL